METHEPAKADGVQGDVGAPERSSATPTTAAWSEEERGHVAVFFTLLDQWDRELRRMKGAA